MQGDAALQYLADLSGVFREFTDMQGIIHPTLPPTQRALIAANGLAAGTDAEVRESIAALEDQLNTDYVSGDVVVNVGQAQSIPLRAPATWAVLSEEDGALLAEGRAVSGIDLPGLPIGVHILRLDGAVGVQRATLIVAPERCPSVRDLTGQDRLWGVVASIYGLRSDPLKSLGDFDDLASLARTLGQHAAGFLGVNPVHALGIAASDTISPYSPTHRGFLNTDHIAVRQHNIPDANALLDYTNHRKTQRPALLAAFKSFEEAASEDERRAFDSFCAQGGTALDDFARFEAKSAHHGPDWRSWPEHTREADPGQVRYHKWAQWMADTQLARAQRAARDAGMALGLYLDLAVGARIGGAESWGDISAAAPGVTLGAPPDQLSPAGQNWQLAALSPRKLQAGRYDALRLVLRRNMRHCGVLRIDHALGLSRSFWIPQDGSPGGYIRQPFQSLMAIIAIEAQRAGTVIVGEDLGLVPPGFRDEMAARGLYGYSVLQYEKDAAGQFLPARTLRGQSLACFGTHDTPTLAGFWQGRDIDWWEKLGWITASDAVTARQNRQGEKRQLSGIGAPEPLPDEASADLRAAVHATLATAPAALVAVQLDDILGLTDAQNLPGTIDEHPNWRRTYPASLGQIGDGPDLKQTADLMAASGRSKQMRKDSA